MALYIILGWLYCGALSWFIDWATWRIESKREGWERKPFETSVKARRHFAWGPIGLLASIAAFGF